MRILIVDDNQDAVESLSILLRMDGHDVKAVTRGDEALAYMPEIFDLIILDIKMPGVGGWEVASKFRRHGHRAVIACLSGLTQPQDIKMSMQSGCDFHLTKPIDFDKLAEVLSAAEHRANVATEKSPRP
jgi:DNA-binding response OmpR family regulator